MKVAPNKLSDLTAEQVKSLFVYDPATGVLCWRNPAGRHGRISAGTVAGTTHPEGYCNVTVNGRRYRAARLIWLYVTGSWPNGQIDHINHNTGDDRWKNLRDATQSQNKANCRTYKKKSCSLKGVQAVQKRHSIRYRAVATKDGVRLHLGNFDTEMEAHLAYVKAAAALHGEYAFAGQEAVTHG